MPRPEMLLEERWRREGVGWVGPMSWWAGLGSEGSTGSKDGVVEVVDVMLWFDATDAECCARRAVSSLVRRFTCRLSARALTDCKS